MARNILLTSLRAAEESPMLRYFSLQKEFGFDYCDALSDAEAGIKAMLARYAIDEIIVIGSEDVYDSEEDLKPFMLKDGKSLYSKTKPSLSYYELLRYRLAQYADELNLDMKEADGLMSGKEKEKLISFIEDYREKDPVLKDKKLNRLFDELSQNDEIRESFRNALSESHPGFKADPAFYRLWVKNYLYSILKDSLKLELLSINEKTSIRLIPEEKADKPEFWSDSMVSMQKSIVNDGSDINLYVLLNSEDAADTFVVINMLDILVSMPGSGVRLNKILTVRNLRKKMTGIIRDDTKGFGVTELFHAINAFLNYGKADMIADLWQKSGELNESISGMVYAMRHVDVGLSMCNIPEVEGGILRLRELFGREKSWQDFGAYGVYFSVVAESIREDYGPLLEGDADIPFIDLVKWAYRHQFYQQTLTLIESKAPVNLVRSGIFYYCNDENSTDQVARLFAEKRLELKPYEYYKIDDIDHYFVKTYDRSGTRGMGEKGEDTQHVYATLRTGSVDNKDPLYITGFTACDNKETLHNILFAYYHVGDVRNKISHADAQALKDKRLMTSESDESSALIWMKDSIDFFIDSYEKAMAQVKDKKPNVVTITGDYVRMIAEGMKHDRHKDN